ncbi:MAG TPA: hypothetical protein VH538_08915 [Gaiellaceae bacterium]|jgi:hypothetical protein
MAELTNLESKLGEVTGLAMAAKATTARVSTLAKKADRGDLVDSLGQMHSEADETETRCTQLAGELDGKKTAILDEARETKSKAAEMLKIYLDDDSDVLDGYEFLVMAEAGEVGHWRVLQQLASSARRQDVVELVDWALPIQERHFKSATGTSERLAAAEDPNGSG